MARCGSQKGTETRSGASNWPTKSKRMLAMPNRSMVGLLLLAGLCGSVFTGLLERVVAPQPALAFVAEHVPPTIQAQQFELIDATGAVRGVPRMAPGGTGPEVALLDEAGRGRATMMENAEG